MTTTETTIKGLAFTPHPVVDVLVPPLDVATQGRMLLLAEGEDRLLEYHQLHEAMIRDAVEDPLKHGFELAYWHDLRALLKEKEEVYALGGNGPGKTEIGGKVVVEVLCEGKHKKVLCISQNENTSRQLQQAAVYKYLPASYRLANERGGSRRRGVVTKITYSVAGGFTESTFVLPTGSQCWFKTVEQFERDANSFEGPEYDLIWADEPIPIALRETLSYRVGKRGGKFLFTFTAVHGYDAICASILEGAKVVKSLPMNWQWKVKMETGNPEGEADPNLIVPELKVNEVQIKGLPAGHMPYIMQPLNRAQGIIFLWTHWNRFLPRSTRNPHAPAIFDKCVKKSKSVVRTRLYGWTEKLAGSQFPTFNTNVHVIPHEKVAEMLVKKLLTTYLSADPATARSYFLLWLGIDSQGRKFIYDESPRLEEGEWVSEGSAAGDGTKLYAARGVNFYKTYIRLREREHGIEALRRFGDPRAFATQAAAAAGGSDLFQLFEAEGEDGSMETAPMFFEPAKVMRSLLAETVSGSLDKINDAFSYDEDKAISVENEPQLYISDRCQNLIRALLNWNPEQGEKSPWKDPIDTLRYLFGEELYYSDPTIPEVSRGGGWGARRK